MSTIALHIDGHDIQVVPSAEHEYLISTDQVALGYGVTPENIRSHKARKGGELLEGKHWVTVANSNGGAEITYWTKRGVIRLGFFIRSPRAAKFRDMAEDLVLREVEHVLTPVHAPVLPSFADLERLAGLTTRAITAQVEEVKAELREEINLKLGEQPLRGKQLAIVHGLVNRLAKLMGGTPRHHSEAWRRLKGRFSVASYRDLVVSQYDDAVRFLNMQIASYDAGQPLLGE